MVIDEAVSTRPDIVVPLMVLPETVCQHIRYEQVRRTLRALTAGPPQRVVAIGPEGGLDALWLASQGHDVTLADPNDGRLGNTRRRIRRFVSQLGPNVHNEPMTVDDLLTDVGERAYDLALCHGAATPDPQPERLISNIGKLVRPGGHLSVLERGLDGVLARLVADGNHREADRLRQTSRARYEGSDGWGFRPERLSNALRDAGAISLRGYGVCVTRGTDVRRVRDVAPKELAVMVAEQEFAGRQPELLGSAALLHFIGKMGGVVPGEPTPLASEHPRDEAAAG